MFTVRLLAPNRTQAQSQITHLRHRQIIGCTRAGFCSSAASAATADADLAMRRRGWQSRPVRTRIENREPRDLENGMAD